MHYLGCVNGLVTLYLFPDCSVLSVLRAHLLEHTIQCLLMKGDTASAADKVPSSLVLVETFP